MGHTKKKADVPHAEAQDISFISIEDAGAPAKKNGQVLGTVSFLGPCAVACGVPSSSARADRTAPSGSFFLEEGVGLWM